MRATLDRNIEIAAIGDLSRDQLVSRWAKIYGCQPPVGVRRELLAYAVAWHAQAKQLGGHSTQVRKAIRDAVTRVSLPVPSSACKSDGAPSAAKITSARNAGEVASETRSGTPAIPSARTVPRVGARLIREWNGKANVVDVIENGFQFESEKYSSLSAIARKITGAHWSGPRFFGL